MMVDKENIQRKSFMCDCGMVQQVLVEDKQNDGIIVCPRCGNIYEWKGDLSNLKYLGKYMVR